MGPELVKGVNPLAVFGGRGLFTWKSVAYVTVGLVIQKNTVMAGRAVGLRSDDAAFGADSIFPPIWSDTENWLAAAKERLDTFLQCECTIDSVCQTHQAAMADWLHRDIARFMEIASHPPPEAVQHLMEREKSKQSRIIVPCR